MKTIFSGKAHKTTIKGKNAIKFGLDNTDYIVSDEDYMEAGKDYTVVIIPGAVKVSELNLIEKSIKDINKKGMSGFIENGGSSILMGLLVVVISYFMTNKGK